MKKNLLFFSFCFLCIACTAQLSDYRYFIRFTDKNNSAYSISNPSEYLSAKSIQRRSKQNIPVDMLDIPVNQQYLDSLVAHGATLFNCSKWLNGVSVSVPDSIQFFPYLLYRTARAFSVWVIRLTELNLNRSGIPIRLRSGCISLFQLNPTVMDWVTTRSTS